jgi:diguanylate cyclase (GGDEF)-like protein
MNSDFARIRDARVVHDGEAQGLIVEFNDGKVRQFSAKELYEATGYLGQPPPEGMSELTGLPNRVMLNRVLLPGLFKAVAAKRQPLGCILISPEGLTRINGKYGRESGDQLIKEFTDCLKSLARNGERLLHLESVNFALLSPNLAEHQLRKRADGIHKELSARRFTINGDALSIGVSIGFSAIQSYTGTPPKACKKGSTSVRPKPWTTPKPRVARSNTSSKTSATRKLQSVDKTPVPPGKPSLGEVNVENKSLCLGRRRR